MVKRVIVTPDKHFPYADKKAIKCLIKSIEIIKPDVYVDLGDIGEWESVAHWQWKKKKRPPLEYQLPSIDKEILVVNECVDEIDEALDKVNCTEKYITEGNHDDWMNRFAEENEHEIFDRYRFKNALRLDERGYEFYPIGDYLKLGHLYLYHGHHYGGIFHSRNHLLKLGVSTMYGHWHDLQQHAVTHMDGAKSAWSIGCLKDMTSGANAWLGGRKINWSHAFAVVDFFDSGMFTVHIQQIIDGKTSLNGKLLKG